MGLESSSGLGVRNWYGASVTATDGKLPNKFGGEVASSGLVREVEYLFTYDDLPAAGGAGKGMEYIIPKGASLLKAYIQVVSAMTGTTGTLTIGTEQADGTDIDLDGIDAAVAQASLTAGALIVCDGAQVGTTVSASYDARVVVTTGGTVTGGKFRLVLQILPPVWGATGDEDRTD